MPTAWIVALITTLFGTMAENPTEAEAVSVAVSACAEREAFDPVVVLSIIGQESSFKADPCAKRARLDRILSREPVEGHEDREVISWACGSSSGSRPPCSRTVWEIEERGDYLYFDTCPAGEVGYMQVLRSSEWARAGFPIPGTETVLVSMSDGVQTAFALWPEATHETVAVLINDVQIGRSRFAVTPLEGSAATLSLRDAPASGDRIVAAEALSTSSRERRAQLLTARINIALGCAELAAHREAAAVDAPEKWWTWIGAYNTGTPRGDTARAYARRILRRYLDFCAANVPREFPSGATRLDLVWNGCTDAKDALEAWD